MKKILFNKRMFGIDIPLEDIESSNRGIVFQMISGNWHED